MILLLAHLDDRAAVRIFCALRSRLGPARVRLVSSEELILAPRWAHRLDGSETNSVLGLADGTSVRSNELDLVYQRLRYVPVTHLAGAKPIDREYAATELHALLLSWLASLPCPVVNSPRPRGLGGVERSLPEWLHLAAKAGLPIPRARFASNARRWASRELGALATDALWLPANAGGFDRKAPLPLGRSPVTYLEPLGPERRRVTVVGNQVLGVSSLDAAVEACRRLARLSDCELMDLWFARGADGWKFSGATPLPDLEDAETVRAATDFLHERSALNPV